MDFIDQRFKTVGELFFVDVPIAEAGVIVFALAEPAVVHDEAIDAEGGGLFRERLLSRFVDAELGGLPGVVNHRTGLGIRRLRKNVLQLEYVEKARGAAEAVIGVAAVEDGSFEFFAGIEFVAEIEWVESAGDTDGIELRFFDGEAPGAGPGERAKPDFAMFFAGGERAVGFLAVVPRDGEPWIGLMAG